MKNGGGNLDKLDRLLLAKFYQHFIKSFPAG